MRPHRSKQYKGRTYLNINRRMLGVGGGGVIGFWLLLLLGFVFWGFSLGGFFGGGFGVLFFFC